MQRLLSLAPIGAALIALCASAATWSAEVDIGMPAAAGEPAQSSAPAQPQTWTPPRPSFDSSNAADDAGTGRVPTSSRREQGADSGGAVLMPFSSAPAPTGRAPTPHGAALQASQGGDVGDLVLTLVAVLAGVGAVAWLVRSA